MEDVEMEDVEDSSAFALQADKWRKAVEGDEGNVDVSHRFRSLLYKHFSETVFECFEVQKSPPDSPVLKLNINEDKCCDRVFRIMEYFLCGEDPKLGYPKLQQTNNPPPLCGKMFKYGEPTYSCRDCGYDGTCVLCIDCFQKSIHRNHRYRMNTSLGSGFCDCGDDEAWKEGACCNLHKQGSTANADGNPVDKLSEGLVQRASLLYMTSLHFCIEMIMWDTDGQLPEDLEVTCNEDAFFTMLFNDEVHTYDEVIRTLRDALPHCYHETALSYANTVDREGRAAVRSGRYQQCEESRKVIKQGTSGPGRLPLRCRVMHHKVVAYQLFSLRLLSWLSNITSLSDGLRRLFCNIAVNSVEGGSSLLDQVLLADATLWKSARMSMHKVFINTMLIDSEGKKWFAVHFAKNYKKMMEDFVADDHEHSLSGTSYSVQVFTVPTLARMLVLEHDILIVIIETFMKELNCRVNDGTFEFSGPFQPLKRAQYVLVDLKYVLQHKPETWTERLREKFICFLEVFFTLLKMMQGMDMVTRKTGQHIETDPEWESAFTIQLRMMPIFTMVNDWCVGDLLVYQNSVLDALKALLETGKKYPEMSLKDEKVAGQTYKVIKYNVAKAPVSIHLPVSRFLAGLILACDKFNLTLNELFNFENEHDRLKLFLVEYPLRALAMVAQVHAGMWRRNGYAIMNQVYHYQNVKCRTEMYDKDVIMMQAAAGYMDANHFLVMVLDKFNMVDWFMPTFDESKYDGDQLSQMLTLAEEVMSLIIAVIGERYMPGISHVTQADCYRREIIHKLCIKPLSHSELLKALPPPDFDLENERSLDDIISDVAIFRKPGVTGKGLYELKEEHYKEFNPFFFHYTRIEQAKAEEQQRKRAKKEKIAYCCPPPQAPQFTRPFCNILNLLSCDVMITLVTNLLTRAGAGNSKALNDIHMHQVLHVVAMALQEAQTCRKSGKTPEKDFITAASTETESRPSLLKLLEGLHDNTHVQEHSAMIDWVLKKFHKELDARKETGQAQTDRPARKDTSQLEDEKARKARLAQQRRAKIMAQMSALQKAFIKENSDLLESMKIDDEENTCEDTGPIPVDSLPIALGRGRQHVDSNSIRYPLERCILCQEQQEVSTEGSAVVMAAFVQRSSVLSRVRGMMFDDGEKLDPLYPDVTNHWGVHTSSCGHIMHSICWQGFYDSVVAKERRALRLRQFVSVDVNRQEYLCPLCGAISNTVVPILPALTCSSSDSAMDEVALAEFLSSMQDVVMSNVALLTTEKTRTGTRFSATLKDMMTVYSQSCYTVGLGVEPNEKDARVPVMVWSGCAFNIQSQESYMRSTSKPLFSGMNSRQLQCIGTLTRLAAVVGGNSDSNVIRKHCLHLLAALTPDVIPNVETPSILEMDFFNLLVKLRLSMPSLQYQEPADESGSQSDVAAARAVLGLDSSSSMDLCAFQLCLAAQLASALLTIPAKLTDDEEMEHSGSSEEETGSHLGQTGSSREVEQITSLWGKVRQYAGVESATAHPSPWLLRRHLRSKVLPFLRCAALFYHFLTEIPGPSSLKAPHQPTAEEEWEALCHYLSVPVSLTELLHWNHDTLSFSSSVVALAVERWCSDDRVKQTIAAKGHQFIGYSTEPSHLLDLPRDYSELINKASLFTCPNSEGDESRAPALCLICGEMLCSQSYCCQTEVRGGKVGACAAHAQKCGAGVGVFLRVRECQILLMANRTKGSFYPAPYLDTYGETDQGLRRGNPLYLCPDRYNKLQKLWLTHGIAEEVARCLESNRNLLSIDWTIL
ncbi:E3 ubiquitin-protein ligase UBR2 isoform X2 [Nematostella vectensis]|uniref:E3 ubiquitin-protein ligase UBR2 isoform X2 n=1 Tax=Nematostella vectensis TaxID=45351 RepID=UPI0020771825|nr:E3 ubiquitin-protein ligase UBR2 isoform X2 [Nematostella vectensis]